LDPGGYGVLGSGERVGFLDEQAWWALSDSGYSRDELLFDTAWAGGLAGAIAGWAGAKAVDSIRVRA